MIAVIEFAQIVKRDDSVKSTDGLKYYVKPHKIRGLVKAREILCKKKFSGAIHAYLVTEKR